jgi:hypothetical protein
VTPPPPQLSPVPAQVVAHGAVWPQLLSVAPHLLPAQVVDSASSVHALHWPLAELQPNGQLVPALHCPLLPHVCCIALPLQRLVFGAQTPPHRPVDASQTFGHVVAVPYVPLTSQCLELPPVQASVPGTHSPLHNPVAATQTNWQGDA